MTDFLGRCATSSCGLLDGGGSGSGTALSNNNKLVSTGVKQIGTTDATNVEFITDNKIRAILDSNGNFDVKDLSTSEVNILPNQQFVVVSGTATLSNYESTITTSSVSDQFRTSNEFIPETLQPGFITEEVVVKFDGSASNLSIGVIDTIGSIRLCASSPSISPNDTVKLLIIKTAVIEELIFIEAFKNDVQLSGVQIFANLDLDHYFYFSNYSGSATIIQSKVNDVDLKGSINLADKQNFGLRIGEGGSPSNSSSSSEYKTGTDYIEIDTLNDSMVLSNVTDINAGSMVFNNNQIVIKKELVGSQESMAPNSSIVALSNFSTLTLSNNSSSGSVLTVSADESNITIPITPTFTVGDKFELTLNLDKQTVGTNKYYVGVGEYSAVPLNYLTTPVNVYPNVYYSAPTGFGGSFAPPGIWSVNPNFSAPNYNTVGLFEIKLVLEESGEFNVYIDGIIKFSSMLIESYSGSTFECFIWSPTQGTTEFDTSYASMFPNGGDGGIVIDGYPVAQTFNQLLGGDPISGVMTFKQVNTMGLIIGDEGSPGLQGIDPTTDNSIRFGQGGGIIDAEVLDLTANTRLRISRSGVGEVMAVDYENEKLALENYHLETKRIDIGAYQIVYSLQPTEWVTLFNSSANGSLWIQNAVTARGTSKGYTQNLGTPRDFIYEIKSLTPHRHWIGISDSNVDGTSLAPSEFGQAYWFKISYQLVDEENFYRVYTNNTTFVDEVIDTEQNYPPGTKIKFEINSNNQVRLYLALAGSGNGSLWNQVSTAVYTIPDGMIIYGRISDTSPNVGDSEIDLQVTDVIPDFSSKDDNINIYSGTNIQFENSLRITQDVSSGAQDWIVFDVANDDIEIRKDIQCEGTISCTSLFTDNALYPINDTSKMLTLSTPYIGQLFYNNSEGTGGKLCVYNGTSWQSVGETFEGISAGSSFLALLRGQPVQINVNPRGVSSILLNGSNLFAGIVCFKDAPIGDTCTISNVGAWHVLCDAGTYVTGQYLHTSTTGRAIFTASAASQTFAIILENVTLSSPGLVLAKLRIYPP